MKVRTSSTLLRRLRRDVVELILDNHPQECQTCERNTNCELQKLSFELGIRDRPWRILFPVGRAGCIDGVAALRGGVDFDQFQELRKGNAIVDLGNVAANRIEGCRADYYVLTYYDRYRAEAAAYPKEMATYEAVIGPGRTAALFRPVAGQSGGPVVRIVTTKTP